MAPGIFANTGGVNTVGGTFYVGMFPGSNGSYNLSGTGRLTSPNQDVGYSGSGSFTQSGGVNTITFGSGGIALGYTSSGSGTYVLGGSGEINAPKEYVGNSGTGSFAQSGGTNSISGTLYLGYSPDSMGAYSLSGSGILSAGTAEYVGYASNALAQFQQTGGVNTTPLLSIGSSGSYLLSEGTLQITGSLVNQGVFTGDGAPATLLGSGVVDLSRAGPERAFGQHGQRLAADRARGVQLGHGLCQLQHARADPYRRQHVEYRSRPVLRGFAIVKRPGQLPGYNFRRRGRHDQSQQRPDYLRYGQRAARIWKPDVRTTPLPSSAARACFPGRTNMSAPAARGPFRRPPRPTLSAVHFRSA